MFEPSLMNKQTFLESVCSIQTQYCESGKSMICLFDLILYVSVNNFSVMYGWVFLGWTSSKQGLMRLAQGIRIQCNAACEARTHNPPGHESTTEPERCEIDL